MNMDSIRADDTRLLKDVAYCVEPVEIYDTRGKILGLFVPANLERIKEKYAQLQAMIDWEEVARRGKDPANWVRHGAVVARLKELHAETECRKVAGKAPLNAKEAKEFMRAAFPHTGTGHGPAS
jgi:hypothetical protein